MARGWYRNLKESDPERFEIEKKKLSDNNRRIRKERRKKEICWLCGNNPIIKNKRRCLSCISAESQRWKLQVTKALDKILNHYGSFCQCCGETKKQFLTIDHINNDGYMHKLSSKKNGSNFYFKIIKEGFPPDLRILCFNCNCGRARNGGICPHVKKN